MEDAMKQTTMMFALALLLGAVAVATAQESVLPATADKAAIEKNLLIGLNSENQGLSKSCALMLGKIRSSKAVIPLMKVLHTNPDADARAAAAYALCRIGSSVGTYAVKMAVRFDEDPQVRLRCAWFYETYVASGTFAFRFPEAKVIALNN